MLVNDKSMMFDILFFPKVWLGFNFIDIRREDLKDDTRKKITQEQTNKICGTIEL